jgi:hypothetical protein
MAAAWISVRLFWSSPGYSHRRFTAHSDIDPALVQQITQAFVSITADNQAGKAVLDGEACSAFVPGQLEGWDALEAVAEQEGLIWFNGSWDCYDGVLTTGKLTMEAAGALSSSVRPCASGLQRWTNTWVITKPSTNWNESGWPVPINRQGCRPGSTTDDRRGDRARS